MKRKSLVAMLVVFAMSVSLLAGCGSKTEKPAETTKKTEESKEDAKAAEPTEITVVTSYGGDDGNRQNYENAVASYQEARMESKSSHRL